MHETSVAQSMIDVILKESQKQGMTPIRAKISCGQLNTLNDEVFGFAFKTIAKGTHCQDMTLDIRHKTLQGKCDTCAATFDLDFSDPRCSACQGSEFKILPDAPLLLEEIEFQEE